MKHIKLFEEYSSLKVILDDKIKMKINIDDTVLGGKFKNKKIKVKKIGINDKGDISINNKPFSKFRISENLNTDIKIGDYVLVSPSSTGNMPTEYTKFVSSNFGKIIKLPSSRSNLTVIKYDNIPTNLSLYFKNKSSMFYKPDIIELAKTKKDAELMLYSRRYNL